MRLVSRLIVLLVVLTPTAVLVLAWLALSGRPLLVDHRTLGPEDVARARAILTQQDPRRLPSGATQQIALSEREVNLAANYLLQGFGKGSARVRLHPARLELAITLHLPVLGIRRFLNVRADLIDSATGPTVANLEVGRLAIPDGLARWLLAQGLRQVLGDADYRRAQEALQGIDFGADELAVTYRWQPELLETVRQGLMPPSLRTAVAAYRDKLVELHEAGVGTRGSLTSLLQPLFAYARSRAGDPADENRALLLVLGAWASGRRLDPLTPPTQTRSASPRRFRLSLEGRYDFAQHFLISAAIAANSDGALANAVGLFKELSDVDRGSGFSFTDIAADRAGTRFGELAVRSTKSAQRLQQRLAESVRETDLAPRLRDLPEHLSDAEFNQRYGAVDSPAYRAVIAEIEQRLDTIPLLRE